MVDSQSFKDVQRTAESYYRAMVAGDGDRLRDLFDPRAPIAGNFEGNLLWQSLDLFIAEAQNLVGQHGVEACVIEGVRIDGDLATVTVAGRYAGLWFRDHLAMIRSEGRWKIAAKTFQVVS